MKCGLALIGLFLSCAAHADSLPVNVIGYPEFCDVNPTLCAASDNAVIFYTPSLESLLSDVQTSVNDAIEFRPDIGSSAWRLKPRAGDCEDYAVTKLDALLRYGLPRGALRLTVVQSMIGGGYYLHMVLVARTTAGDFVLDNRYRRLKRKDSLPYLWFAEERPVSGRMVFYSINAEWAEFFQRKNWW